MYKKTLLSLAVASSVALTGCIGTESGDDEVAVNPLATSATNPAGTVWPLFNPATGEVPIPSDLNFDQDAADGSFGVDGDMTNPVIGALNNLSGASTVAPAVIRMSGNIDVESVDSRAFITNPNPQSPLPVIPNPNQNVFLIELAYASGEPVRALSAGEPPTIPLAITFQLAAGQNPLGNGRDLQGRDQQGALEHITGLAATPAYDHDVVQLDGESAIRIRPTKPLNPLSRYVVVVSDSITNVNGTEILGSPLYQALGEVDEPLPINALAPVKTLITSFWENIGANYFALNNSSRTGFGLPALDKDNIALSYSFTTSEDKKVLSHIANPANWLADQIKRSVTIGAARAAVNGGAEDFGSVFGAVTTALTTFEPSVALDNSGLAPCDDTPYDAGPFGVFEDQFLCVGTLVKGAVGVTGTLEDTLSQLDGISFPQPSARDFAITQTTDALALSGVLASLNFNAGEVDVHQGSISLPQYIAVPDATQTGITSSIRSKSWTPDSPLAAVLGEALGATIPQEDSEVSTVLNYIFPFPELEADVQVPMLVITPTGLDPTVADTNLIPVIFQHGITTDRSAALAFGSQLVASAQSEGVNLAVFAIDQPLHGVSPASTERRTEIAGSLLTGVEAAVSAPAGTFNNETLRTAAVNGETQVLIDAGIPEANASVIVGTVERSGSTIPGLAPASTDTGVVAGVNERHYGFTAGADNNPVAMDFEEGFGSSGSLFINLTNFINSRDILRQGSIDLMNLTATINGTEMAGVTKNGVHFIGHSLGTLNGGAFVGATTASSNPALLVASAHLLTPVAGTTRLLENSPSFAPTILGGLQVAAGLSQGDADLETFLNVNQASLDAVDPINFANELAVSNTVLGQVEGDRTTPNAADTRYGEDKGPLDITFPNGLRVQSPEAPLSGSEALAKLMGATATEVPLALPMITRYTVGVHATPVLPTEEIAEAGDVLKDRTIATGGEVIVSAGDAQTTFGTMVGQSLLLIQSQTP